MPGDLHPEAEIQVREGESSDAQRWPEEDRPEGGLDHTWLGLVCACLTNAQGCCRGSLGSTLCKPLGSSETEPTVCSEQNEEKGGRRRAAHQVCADQADLCGSGCGQGETYSQGGPRNLCVCGPCLAKTLQS